MPEYFQYYAKTKLGNAAKKYVKQNYRNSIASYILEGKKHGICRFVNANDRISSENFPHIVALKAS
jgi:hypothetical protein